MHQNTGIDGQQDTLDSSLSARFFRLIDCSKRAVVEAPPESPYVALSYVWGASKHDSPSVPDAELQWPSALEKLPRTIDDCIQATLSFGIRYLWIDRYCINQADPEAKMNQVSRMDMIYANATLTIIAAAGNGPDFGLPGVNKTKRSSQPSLRIGDITLASTLPSPRSSLQGSTWASRGWTYQEGLLSKRRLIFTHQQTYFECNGMHIGE
ncbi:HET-domain-containing protein, partial [Cadophora sp. DSE1049]